MDNSATSAPAKNAVDDDDQRYEQQPVTGVAFHVYWAATHASVQCPLVRLNRLLKYLNVLIGLFVVVIIALIYWFAVRPLPKTSGAIQFLSDRPATATRDDLGVPHIKAATIEDALFVQGYVTAQDRLWQMDIMRRAAAGELSEVIGRATIELDREARSASHRPPGGGARANFAAAGPRLSRRICARSEPLHRYASRCAAA